MCVAYFYLPVARPKALQEIRTWSSQPKSLSGIKKKGKTRPKPRSGRVLQFSLSQLVRTSSFFFSCRRRSEISSTTSFPEDRSRNSSKMQFSTYFFSCSSDKIVFVNSLAVGFDLFNKSFARCIVISKVTQVSFVSCSL